MVGIDTLEVNRLDAFCPPGRGFALARGFRADFPLAAASGAKRPDGTRGRVFSFAYYALAATAVLAVVACAWVVRHQRVRRRHGALQSLMDNADRLETDLKDCRDRLQRAHAVMSVSPDVPAAGEIEAQQAVDSGLRALLQQRLWIRDRGGEASQRELDDAVAALVRARHQLEPRLRALDDAQAALDSAVRDHIHKDF